MKTLLSYLSKIIFVVVVLLSCFLGISSVYAYTASPDDDDAFNSGKAVKKSSYKNVLNKGVGSIGYHAKGAKNVKRNFDELKAHHKKQLHYNTEIVIQDGTTAITDSDELHSDEDGNPQVLDDRPTRVDTSSAFLVINPGGQVLRGNGATHGNAWWKQPASTSSQAVGETPVGAGLTPAQQRPATPVMTTHAEPHELQLKQPHQSHFASTKKQQPAKISSHTVQQVINQPVPQVITQLTPQQVPMQVPQATPVATPQLTPQQIVQVNKLKINLNKPVMVIGQATLTSSQVTIPYKMIITPQQIILIPSYNHHYHHPNYVSYVQVHNDFDKKNQLYNVYRPYDYADFHLIIAGVREPTPRELVNWHPNCHHQCKN